MFALTVNAICCIRTLYIRRFISKIKRLYFLVDNLIPKELTRPVSIRWLLINSPISNYGYHLNEDLVLSKMRSYNIIVTII